MSQEESSQEYSAQEDSVQEDSVQEDQPLRLVDMLEMEDKHGSTDRLFEKYKLLCSECEPKTVVLVWIGSNHEMYWKEGSPGSESVQEVIKLLGLKSVQSQFHPHHYEAWFGKTCREAKFAALAEAGWKVKVAIVGGRGEDMDLELL